MLLVYQIIVFIISLISLPILVLIPKTREKLLERYGLWNLPKGEYYWFHAASVGEINGLLPLISFLKKEKPEAKILGTATSLNGRQLLLEHCTEARLLPIDNVIYLNKALAGIVVKKFVFGETELWPALLLKLKKLNVEIYLVNGRISDFKVGSYRIVKPLLKEVFLGIRSVFAIDQNNANNFLDLGLDEAKIKVTGNLKFDRSCKYEDIEEFAKYRAELFPTEKPIVVLGSLRPGEEEFWLPVFEKYQKIVDFLLVPRHLNKVEYFRNKTSVKVLDTFGTLEKCYAISDLVFIGGSLIDGIGGHNPIEAAAYSKPIIMGPYYQNQRDAVKPLLASEGIKIVKSTDEINVEIDALLADSNTLDVRGAAALNVYQSFQGLTDKIYHEIFTSC